MPLIAKVGRNAPRPRIIMAGFYTVLIMGALSVLFPFLLLLAHSVSSETDQYDYRIVPRYLYRTDALYRKCVADKYGHRFIANYNRRYGTTFEEYRDLPPVPRVNERFVTVWREFRMNRIPRGMKQPAFEFEGIRKFTGPVVRLFREYVLEKYGSLDGVSRAFAIDYRSLDDIRLFHEDLLSINWYPVNTTRCNDWLEMKQNLDPSLLYAVNGEGLWQYQLSQQYYGDIRALNRTYGTAYRAFNEIPFREREPENPHEARDREKFIRTKWPLRFTETDPAAAPGFRAFLEGRYGTISAYNRENGTQLRSFADIGIPDDMDTYRAASRLDWRDYFSTELDLKHVSCVTAERMFRSHLLEKYANIRGINSALGTSFAAYYDIRPPWLQADWQDVADNAAGLRAYYLTRNYREVIEHLTVHGRSLMVTVVYVGLILLAQLIINPMCAYALSRFNLRYADRIVLFLLATMAFPVEVTMIPNFLFIRELGLLNTFWALILPAVANGYFIFILKGYFDNMPVEMYEAADLDGAGETTIYFKIVAPQVRPVLAWMTLSAFMTAYGAFMFAMILCQDSRMWTLMVWIYDMQNTFPPYVISAALVVAGIPSVIVFVVCQRIIIRSTGLPATL